MNAYSLLAVALALTATTAFAADGTFDKTLDVQGAPTISISTGSGYLHIYSGPDSRVHITGHVHIRSGIFTDADARVQQIVASPPITQSGNILTIGPRNADDLYRNVSIDYDVLTPHTTTLKSSTGSGNIEIGGIDSLLSAESGSGSIKAENIGPGARLETGSGSIHASNVRGSANLQTGSGDLDLALTGAGDIKAQTGSGSIHISGASGGLRAGTGSGTIEIAGNPTSEWRLDTGSGSLHLKLDPAAHFKLNADSGSGGIQVDRPIVMEGALNRHHVTGTVNGGGPTIRANTGSGNITIQ